MLRDQRQARRPDIRKLTRGPIALALISIPMAVIVYGIVLDRFRESNLPLWTIIFLSPYLISVVYIGFLLVIDDANWPDFWKRNGLLCCTIFEVSAFFLTSLLMGGIAIY